MSKIYLKTPAQGLGRRELGRISHMTITWCKRNLGINHRKAYQPIWSLSSYNEDTKLCGDYDDVDNEITIYYKNIDDIRELISTIIHEWTHQLQPCRSKYNKWKGTYQKNPLEVEAFEAESLYLSPCWKAIKDKVNRKV